MKWKWKLEVREDEKHGNSRLPDWPAVLRWFPHLLFAVNHHKLFWLDCIFSLEFDF